MTIEQGNQVPIVRTNMSGAVNKNGKYWGALRKATGKTIKAAMLG